MRLIRRILTGTEPDELSTLIAAFHRRRQQGEALTPAVFACEHPLLARELMDALGHLVAPAQARDDNTDAPPDANDAFFPSLQHYRIVRELGAGGSGVVYLVVRKADGLEFALKYLHNNSRSTPKLIERFRREAEVQQRLQHPNIVSVTDFSKDPTERYIVSELVCGSRTLLDLIQDHPHGLPEAQIFELMTQIVDAIVYSHDCGILHRDVKPSNVMLEADTPKLTDFGLAIVIDKDLTRLTQSNELLGTLAYMPPEMLTGALHASESADVYSLGVTLYEMLTSALPYDADSSVALVKKISEGNPLSPLERNPRVNPQLDAIAMKCISHNPSQRYASASELHADLLRAAGGEQVTARTVSASRRKAMRCLGNWRQAIAVSALAVVFVVTTATLSRTIVNRKKVTALLESRGDPVDGAFQPRFLRWAADHAEPPVRIAALTALRGIGDERAVATIASALRDDPESAVREHALHILLINRDDFPPIDAALQLAVCRDALARAAANPKEHQYACNVALPAVRRLNDTSAKTIAHSKILCQSPYQLVRTEALYTVQWLLEENTDAFVDAYLQDPATPAAGRDYLWEHMTNGRARANLPMLINFAADETNPVRRQRALRCLQTVTSQPFNDDSQAWKAWWNRHADDWSFRLAVLLKDQNAAIGLNKLDVLWTVDGRPITFADVKPPFSHDARQWLVCSHSGTRLATFPVADLHGVVIHEGTIKGKPVGSGPFSRLLPGKLLGLPLPNP